MWRLLTTIIGTAAVVAFAVANTHHVEMSIVIGAPIRVRLIFLLMSTFAVGSFATVLCWQIMALRNRLAERRARTAASQDFVEQP